MKLSQFKGSNIRKKIQFVNGELQNTSVVEQVNGDINFYALGIDGLEKINNEVISKMSDEDSNDLLMYRVIPYITDVECDITFNEFMQMMDNPSKSFIAFINEVAISINEMFGTIEELASVIDNTVELSNNIIANNNESVNTENTKNEYETNISEDTDLNTEALLDNLYEQLSKTSNREDRKKLIKRISDLSKS
jgi:hypothetical protein